MERVQSALRLLQALLEFIVADLEELDFLAFALARIVGRQSIPLYALDASLFLLVGSLCALCMRLVIMLK